ncbi:MAG: anti-CBASS protein Acb1 family protein [Fimbriiglobus sp.]
MPKDMFPSPDHGVPKRDPLEVMVGNQITNFFSRSAFRNLLDPRRDIDKECGFPDTSELTAEYYHALYDREPVAARVVELLPKESWQVSPAVVEDADPETDTEFESAWAELSDGLGGGPSFHRREEGSVVWDYLLRADVLSGIGRYGVIVLGLDDGRPMHEPAEGVEEAFSDPQMLDVKDGKGDRIETGRFPGINDRPDRDWDGSPHPYTLAFNARRKAGPTVIKSVPGPAGPSSPQGDGGPGMKLLFIKVYPEKLAKVIRWEGNPLSPRYGMPTTYLVTLNDPAEQAGFGMNTGTTVVHWTRVIHVADDRGSSEVLGTPRMKQVVNHLLGLRKTDSASPEAMWKGALNVTSLETNPALGGDVLIDREKLRDMTEAIDNGLQKWLVTSGLTAKTLSPTVTDPTPHSNNLVEKICIKLGCPVRVFKGSERGELASSQDDAAWNDRLKHRQDFYLTPYVIVPFVDRLILLGVLPEPADGYAVVWPDLTSVSAADKAGVMLQRTQAYGAYVSGGLDQLVPPKVYMTMFDDMTDEEAEAVLDAAADHAAETEQAAADKQAADIEAGLIPDPDAPPPEIDPETGLPVGQSAAADEDQFAGESEVDPEDDPGGEPVPAANYDPAQPRGDDDKSLDSAGIPRRTY